MVQHDSGDASACSYRPETAVG